MAIIRGATPLAPLASGCHPVQRALRVTLTAKVQPHFLNLRRLTQPQRLVEKARSLIPNPSKSS